MRAYLHYRVFSPFDHVVSNALWFNGHLGVGLYLFSRKHLRRAKMPWRITYSVFGAVIYNFGTLLFWATTKAAILPNNATLRSIVGIGSGCAFLFLGHHYLKFVDTQVGNVLKEEWTKLLRLCEDNLAICFFLRSLVGLSCRNLLRVIKLCKTINLRQLLGVIYGFCFVRHKLIFHEQMN